MASKMNAFDKMCCDKGKYLATLKGGKWQEYAKAYRTILLRADQVLKEYVGNNPEKWNALSREEKTDISAKLIRVCADQEQVTRFMNGEIKPI